LAQCVVGPWSCGDDEFLLCAATGGTGRQSESDSRLEIRVILFAVLSTVHCQISTV
jgi:hypothetical protein